MQKKLNYQFEDSRIAVKVFYPTPLRKENREKYPDRASSLHQQAVDLGFKLFNKRYINRFPAIRTIYSQDETIDGIEIYDEASEFYGFMLVEKGLKSKEYKDFTQFFLMGNKDPKYLPGASKISDVRDLPSTKELIEKLKTQIRYGVEEESKQARKILTKIEKAEIPQKKRGPKTKLALTFKDFLEIDKEWHELEKHMEGKHYANYKQYKKKEKIQKFYDSKGKTIDKEVIEKAISENWIRDIVLFIHACAYGVSFETLKNKFNEFKENYTKYKSLKKTKENNSPISLP